MIFENLYNFSIIQVLNISQTCLVFDISSKNGMQDSVDPLVLGLLVVPKTVGFAVYDAGSLKVLD